MHQRFGSLVLTAILLAVAGGCAGPGAARGPDGDGPVVRPSEGITVRPRERQVEIEAWVCLDAGWLEQIACSPGTREHEALVVIKARPSNVHAALLLAGFEPGTPGEWVYQESGVSLTPPAGDPLDILVRYPRHGQIIEEPIGVWIVDAEGAAFPNDHWVFGGSSFAENLEWMGPGEHFVADETGSIIGLVTFGDEVVGYQRVIADQEAVHPPEWQVNSDHVPPIGTRVTLILRPVS